jgi:hypothetical protein
MNASSAPPASSSSEGGERWIETREGTLFFLNSLFMFPYLMVLIPLATRIFVRGVVGGFEEPSVIVDTFPAIAEYLLPRMGWLALGPAWLTWKNLGLEHRPLPRAVLALLLIAHLFVVGWTVTGWLGVHGGVLPGGFQP